MLFRCTNEDCSDDPMSPLFAHDFEDADKTGTCPKCGATNKDHPAIVVVRTAVHYLVNDPAGAIYTPAGRRSVACQPALKKLTGTHQCTGMHQCVTCPKCLASAVFKQHQEDDVDQAVRIMKKGVPI